MTSRFIPKQSDYSLSISMRDRNLGLVNLKIFNHHTNSYTYLERKSYVKYLGVLIDENLSWKHHILHIASIKNKHINWYYC